MDKSKVLLGAGCFWGVEELFCKLEGVVDTKVGYSGGNLPNPTYEDVCSDTTGHAEVVQIEFDSNKISFEEILDNFWTCHDPTEFNKQGPDVGSQYRSVIFYFTDEQEKIIQESKNKYQKKFSDTIVTEIKLASPFFIAENYHQKYIQKKS
jgi:peptide-methionine (S)-S-oxide reductase